MRVFFPALTAVACMANGVVIGVTEGLHGTAIPWIMIAFIYAKFAVEEL